MAFQRVDTEPASDTAACGIRPVPSMSAASLGLPDTAGPGLVSQGHS
jgi:hypothetical protein